MSVQKRFYSRADILDILDKIKGIIDGVLEEEIAGREGVIDSDLASIHNESSVIRVLDRIKIKVINLKNNYY